MRDGAAGPLVGSHSPRILCDISDLAVTIFAVQAITAVVVDDFMGKWPSALSQILAPALAGTIVLGPFLLSLGLRLGRSNLPASREDDTIKRLWGATRSHRDA